MTWRRFAIFIGCAVMLAACSATIDGRGQTGSRTPSSRTSHDFPSVSPTPTNSTSPASNSRFARTRYATAFGDPPHADLCSVITLSKFAQSGYTPAFGSVQFPPGCTVRLNKSDNTHVSVTVYATPLPPKEATGRTRKIVDGSVVYAYPFKSEFGSCERDLVASRITLVVDSYSAKGPSVSTVACTGTDEMTRQLAAAADRGVVKPLRLSSSSVLDLDACEIVKAAGWSALPVFAGMTPRSDAFDAGCTLQASTGDYAALDPEISASPVPTDATVTTASGHTLYAATYNDAKDCTLTSVQGRTPDGRTEMLFLSADTTKTVPGYCSQVATAFARYLTVAGLR